MTYLRQLKDWLLKLGAHPKAIWILGVMSYFEAIIMPLPVDPILVGVCTAKPKNSIKATIITVVTSVLGALSAYAIAFFFWPSIQPWLEGWLLKPEHWVQIQAFYQKGGFWFVFLGGFTPLPFKLFALSAGAFGAPLFLFFLGALCGRGLRFGIIGGLFHFFGSQIRESIDRHFDKVVWISSGLLTMGLCFYFFVLKH